MVVDIDEQALFFGLPGDEDMIAAYGVSEQLVG